MDEYKINEVIEYANDLKREFSSKDDIDEFNQAIMRLSDAAADLHIIESFDEIDEQ